MPSSGQLTWDAVVIGAGPAGATAARRLSTSGASVLLLEKQPLPRYKACGGGVPARTIQLLDDLDISSVSEGFVDTIDISRFGQHQFRKTSKRPLAWMVMRDRFDQFLTELAVGAGAEVRDAAPCNRSPDWTIATNLKLRQDQFEPDTSSQPMARPDPPHGG